MLITRVRAQSDKSDETGFIKATKESNCRFIHKKSKTFKQQKFFLNQNATCVLTLLQQRIGLYQRYLVWQSSFVRI